MASSINSDLTTLSTADLEAFATLHLEEIEEVVALRKDKRRATSTPPDDEIAFQLYADELKSLLSLVQDQQLARSLAAAVDTDYPLIEELVRADRQVIRDGALARRLEQGESISRPGSGGQQDDYDEDSETKSETGSVYERTSVNTGANTPVWVFGDSSSSNDRPWPENRARCIVCDEFADSTDPVFPCGHVYDTQCAVELFEHASKDESLMPPRCCRLHIPIGLVTPHLSANSRALFLEKLREHRTHNRLYCPDATCSRFIGSADETERRHVCLRCGIQVCAICRKRAHPGYVPCETDTDTQEVIALGESSGWKRCPGCHQMVELSHGCYHMTCLCRTQFCYLCAALWKNCDCVQWDEARLFAAAEQRVQNQIQNDPPVRSVVNLENLVNRAVEQLRDNHECNHPSWTLRQGAARCEECHNYLAKYILCCRSCQMRACVRCTRNRL